MPVLRQICVLLRLVLLLFALLRDPLSLWSGGDARRSSRKAIGGG